MQYSLVWSSVALWPTAGLGEVFYPCYHLHAGYLHVCISETNHVSRVQSFASVPYLQFVLHVMLFRPWNTFCIFTLPLSTVCVQCPIWLFFGGSSLISCSSGMLLRYCLSDFEVVPLTHIITGIAFAFTFHMRWISVVGSLYFGIFSASFLITFLSPEIAISINIHVTLLLLLLLVYHRSVFSTFWF